MVLIRNYQHPGKLPAGSVAKVAEPVVSDTCDGFVLAAAIRRWCKDHGVSLRTFGEGISYPNIVETLELGRVPRAETRARIMAKLNRAVL